MDGTLIETDSLHFEIWKELLKPLMGDIDKTYYQKKISGGSNEQILARLFPEWPKEKCDEWAVKKEALFRERAAKKGMEPVNGFREFIDFISCEGKWEYTTHDSRKIKILPMCVTNAPLENVTFMLDILHFQPSRLYTIPKPQTSVDGSSSTEASSTSSETITCRECLPFIDVFIVDERGCRGKPFPDPYANCMSQHSLLPSRCICFEDSKSGLSSAVSAKVKTRFGLLTTHSEEKLKEAGATVAVKDWVEVKKYGETVEEWVENVLNL